jgi:flagellar assembly protein FliH
MHGKSSYANLIDPALADLATVWGAPEINANPLPTVEDLEAMVMAAREQAMIEGRAEGYTKGYKEGHAEGINLGTQKAYQEHGSDLNRQIERFVALIESLSSPLAQLDEQVETALLEMAIAAAHAVLKVHLQKDDALLSAVIRESMLAAGQQSTALELRVSADDLERVETHMRDLDQTKIRLVVDSELVGGDMRVQAESLRIDGSLLARLQQFAQQVMSNASS